MPRLTFRNTVRSAVEGLRPTQRLRWTWEGAVYIAIWIILLLMGLHQQINLVLLIAGLAAGPIVGSIFVSAGLIKRLELKRRHPRYVFAGDELVVEFQLENRRRWGDALAMVAEQDLEPIEAGAPDAQVIRTRVFFARVPGRRTVSQIWRGNAGVRGRYSFREAELVTRAPFGLLERRLTIPLPGELLVYPAVGSLTRRWKLLHREATEARRGRRHDRSTQQQEYHGLRDYRPGDSPRWIHWRTTARLGVPMVKEFEQQSEQDLAILLDPWAPRARGAVIERELVEKAIRFVATVCHEACRNQGRRLLLGWTGTTPGVVHGPGSTKLLHQMLESLALLKSAADGKLAPLLDSMPPATLRGAMIVIVTTRRIDLAEELARSSRLGDGSMASRVAGRIILLDVSRGDIDGLIQFDRSMNGVERMEPGSTIQADTPNENGSALTPDDSLIGISELAEVQP
jgi:uncharacterized protein (DUF58 family)